MSPAPIALAPALTAPATPEGYPLTTPSSGTALPADEWKQNTKLPLLFTPQKIGGLTLKNRIHVAPYVILPAVAGGLRHDAEILSSQHVHVQCSSSVGRIRRTLSVAFGALRSFRSARR